MSNHFSKKNLLLFSFFVCFTLAGTFSAKAQDFVVTIKRDTLNCKLGKLKNDHYPINFILEEEEFVGTIHKDSILVYRKNMFRGMKDNRLRPWYPTMDFGLDLGMAHQYGPLRLDEEYADKSNFSARSGFYGGADLIFYVSKRLGYGLKYNYRSILSGDINYNYVGGILALRFWENDRKNHLFIHLSGGWGGMKQKNAPIELGLTRPRIEMTANTFVGDISVGYNLRLSQQVSARFKLSGMIGYPGFVRIDEGDLRRLTEGGDKALEIGNYCHNMNTINLSVGFTFHK